jgi:hypothetical protein
MAVLTRAPTRPIDQKARPTASYVYYPLGVLLPNRRRAAPPPRQNLEEIVCSPERATAFLVAASTEKTEEVIAEP